MRRITQHDSSQLLCFGSCPNLPLVTSAKSTSVANKRSLQFNKAIKPLFNGGATRWANTWQTFINGSNENLLNFFSRSSTERSLRDTEEQVRQLLMCVRNNRSQHTIYLKGSRKGKKRQQCWQAEVNTVTNVPFLAGIKALPEERISISTVTITELLISSLGLLSGPFSHFINELSLGYLRGAVDL